MTDPELTEQGTTSTLRLKRRYDHPVERVWRAVTTAEGLRTWFPSPAEIDLREGGEIRFPGFEGETARGRVLAVEEPRLLSFTWGSDRFDFELSEDGAGTVLTLVQAFTDHYGAASFAAGWEGCMGMLAESLDGREPTPPGRMVAEHERLVGVFGLDAPRVTRDGGGWLARFERQLACPADRAWDIFVSTEAGSGPGRTVTEIDRPSVYAFKAAVDEVGDEIEFRLGRGTGHGARLILAVRGGEESDLAPTVERWGAVVAAIAREAAG